MTSTSAPKNRKLCFYTGTIQTPLPVVTQVRYLGVLLEQDLNWMPHITALNRDGPPFCVATVSRVNSMVPPSTCFCGSLNMSPCRTLPTTALCTTTSYIELFRSLQSLARVAYLQVSPARIHTPIAGFQMALGSMPPAYCLIFNNLRTWIRLNNYKTAPDKDTTLHPHLQVLFDDFINTGLAGCHLDAMPKQPNSALINVTISDKWADSQQPPSDIQIYTDGSKLEKSKQWHWGRLCLHAREQCDP
jgi:hypothetical protein